MNYRFAFLFPLLITSLLTVAANDQYAQQPDAPKWGLIRLYGHRYILKNSPCAAQRLAALGFSENVIIAILSGQGYFDAVEYFSEGYYPPNGAQCAQQQNDAFLAQVE